MPKTTIVTCFPMSLDEREALESGLGDDFGLLVSDQQGIASDIFEADIYLGHAKHQQIDWAAVITHGKLKWIQSSAAGLDHCLAPEVIASDVRISGCSGLFARQVAEQVLTLLFGLIRKQRIFLDAQKKKEFNRKPTDNLFNKSVGILGMGGNGQYLASILKPLCRRLVGTDGFIESIDNRLGVELFGPDQTREVFEKCEVIIAMLPLTSATENFIDQSCFDAMPAGGYFINIGRGQTVNETDLIATLQSRKLAGVGLDVVAQEPLANSSPLWSFDKVMISPHVGAQAPNRVSSTIRLFQENVNRWTGGARLVNEVDKDLGFPRPEDRLDVLKEWKTLDNPSD